jgi:hypothetical protein
VSHYPPHNGDYGFGPTVYATPSPYFDTPPTIGKLTPAQGPSLSELLKAGLALEKRTPSGAPREAPKPNVTPANDNVSNPAHYTLGRKYEPIDVIHDWKLPFGPSNSLKYISRFGRKGDKYAHLQDIDKAIFYLTDYRKRVAAGEV